MKNIGFMIFSISIILISLYLAIDKRNDEGFQVGTTGITEICSSTDTNKSCISNVKYIDAVTSETKTVTAKIDPNYYIDSNDMLQIVPYGYIQGPDKRSYIPKTKSAMFEQGANTATNTEIDKRINALLTNANYDKNKFKNKDDEIAYLNKQKTKTIDDDKTSNKAYNSDNVDITYHDDPTTHKNDDDSNAGVGRMWVRDKSGKLISLPYSNVKNTTLYYETGSYPFGPSSYVPNYEESTLLSKSSNQSNVSSIYGLATQKGGFCQATKSSVYNREQKCNQVDVNTCASTGCCVLLGGEKCVAGNESGPSIKANYSDFLITNRDYYYYQGKCYGNCS
jgi:hypothetical protein